MKDHILTGFGFGPIQAALFANEAYKSGNFSRIVVAEVDQALIDAVMANDGNYHINVTKAGGIEAVAVRNVELLNPANDSDRQSLKKALSVSTEIVTSLPSVDFYSTGDQNSVANLVAQGLSDSEADATVIYTAENNNRAAELLQLAVADTGIDAASDSVQFLNTVIGKMSGTITGSLVSGGIELTPIVPGFDRAFLVEEFNSILTTRCTIDGFTPGISVFSEKDDLLPFEEAKLYGHNAIHALLAYLGHARGYEDMSNIKKDEEILTIARQAFYNESGSALCAKYAGVDDLFTTDGYRAYADDLLARMMNPYLGDTILRAGRNVVRKLGSNDRIFGTMSLALEHGINPSNMAVAAAAALRFLITGPEQKDLPENLLASDTQIVSESSIKDVLGWIWREQRPSHEKEIVALILAESMNPILVSP